jgi:hypothetical protein
MALASTKRTPTLGQPVEAGGIGEGHVGHDAVHGVLLSETLVVTLKQDYLYKWDFSLFLKPKLKAPKIGKNHKQLNCK